MTDIELLPMPEGVDVIFSPDGNGAALDVFIAEQVQDYARAVAEHNVRFLTHELANAECAIDAEQADRKKAEAEVEALRVRADAMAGEAIKHEARAERLAEALRELVAL